MRPLLLHAPLPKLVAPDGRDGQEGSPASVPLLEELNGSLGILFPVHHNILHPGPQGRLQRHGIFPIGFHKFVDVASRLIRCQERYGAIFKNLLGRTVVVEDRSRCVLLGVLKGPAGVSGVLPDGLQLVLDRGQLLTHCLLPGGHLLLGSFQSRQMLPPSGGGIGSQSLAGLQGADLVACGAGTVGGRAGLFQKLLQFAGRPL